MMFSAVAGTVAIGAEIAAGTSAAIAGAGTAAAAGGTAVAAGTAGILSASTIQAGAAVAGLGLSAAGLYSNMQGQGQVAQASQKAEDIRQKQAQLQSFREKREIIRRAQAARAIALSNATASGAEFSSVVPGAYGQATGEATRGTKSVNENEALGAQIFQANRDIASGKQQIGTGQGLQELGKVATTVSPQIGAIGATIFGSK